MFLLARCSGQGTLGSPTIACQQRPLLNVVKHDKNISRLGPIFISFCEVEQISLPKILLAAFQNKLNTSLSSKTVSNGTVTSQRAPKCSMGTAIYLLYFYILHQRGVGETTN